MAIYHYSEGNVSRATGRSACAAAAYITGSRITDARQGLTFDYGKRNDVVMVFGHAPENAPEWAKNPEALWNEVASFEDALLTKRFKGHPSDLEKNEKSLRAREEGISAAIEANSIVLALPREFTPLQSKEVISAFMGRYFTPRKLVATVALHDEKDNPHCHILVTTRPLEGQTFSSKKCRDFNNVNELKIRRALWAEVVNTHALEWGLNIKIDHRSFADQGIDLIPTVHEGWYARKHHKESSRLIQENQEIKQENIKLLFKNPEELIRVVSSRAPVVSKNDLLKEIFKRVGGDETLWHLLSDALMTHLKGQEYDIQEILKKNPSNANVPVPLNDAEKALVCERYLGRIEKEGVLISLGQGRKGERLYTTKQVKEREENFEEKVISLKKMTHHGIASQKIEIFVAALQKERGFVLEDEQRASLSALCSAQGICVVEGRAGTGKTFVLSAVKKLYEKEGFKLLGGAFQGRTAEHLEHETGVFSHTLDVYVKRWERLDEMRKSLSARDLSQREMERFEAQISSLQAYDLTDKTVFIVDEAFMVPSHLLHALAVRAEEKGAKIILAGDGRQTLSFTSGDAGRCVSKQVKSVCLENIRRQKADWQRRASLHLSRHDIWEGYALYEEKGHIARHKTKEDMLEAAARAYVTHLTNERDVNEAAKETLLLAPDGASVGALNKRVGALLKEEGHFKEGFVLSHVYQRLLKEEQDLINGLLHQELTPLGYQERERKLSSLRQQKAVLEKERVFYEGQRIVFTSNDHTGVHVSSVSKGEDLTGLGVKNGTQGVIEGFKLGCVFVTLDDGRQITFSPDACPDEGKEFVEAGYAMTVHKAQGLTRKSAYGLFLNDASTRHVTANLLYVLGTRHTDTFEGHFFSEKNLSFKTYLISRERSEYRPLVSDYVVEEGLKEASALVGEYLETKIEKGQLLQSIGELSKKAVGDPLSKNTLSRIGEAPGASSDPKNVLWEQYNALGAHGADLARAIIQGGIEKHAVFLNQAGIHQSALYVEAGLKTRTLSLLEKECARRVHDYADIAGQTRTLWERIQGSHTIVQDHPSYADFRRLKEERDLIAYTFVKEGQTPFLPFLKEERIPKQTLHAHAKSHELFLKEQALKALNPAFVKNLEAYQEAGRTVERAELLSQDTKDHVRARDQKAHTLILSLTEGDQSLLAHFLSSKAQDTLLYRAGRHEGLLLVEAYQSALSLSEKGTRAGQLLTARGLTSLFKEKGIHPAHLSFETLLSCTPSFHTQEETTQKALLVHLETWKNADMARRQMFAHAYKARQIESAQTNKKPLLVVDREIVEPFEKASVTLYEMIACEKDALSSHPLFDQIAKAAFHGVKDRHKKEELTALKESLPKKTWGLQKQDISRFMEQVMSDMDVSAFTTHFLGAYGLSPNERLSSKESLRFGKKGSFLVQAEGPKKGSWISFEENKSGGLVSLITHFQGGTFKDALGVLRPHVSASLQKDFDVFCQGHRPASLMAKRAIPGTKKEAPEIDYGALKVAQVQKIVALSTPVKETQAERYLAARGITQFHEADLAYLPANTSFEYGDKKRTISKGALLSIARNDNGEIRAVQVTPLDGRGARARSYDGEKFQKLTYGVPRGAFVTLARGDGPLFLSEGVETGLSLVEANLQGTVKAALGIHNMSEVTSDKTILLVADWDGVGAASHTTLQKAQTHLKLVTGKEVDLVWPAREGNKKDFNDILCRDGKSGLKRVLQAESKTLQDLRERNAADMEEKISHFEAASRHMKEGTLQHHEIIALEEGAHAVLSSASGRQKVGALQDQTLKEAFYKRALNHEKRNGTATFLTLRAYEGLQKKLAAKDLASDAREALSQTAEEMAYRLREAPHFTKVLKNRFSQDAHRVLLAQAQNHHDTLSYNHENHLTR